MRQARMSVEFVSFLKFTSLTLCAFVSTLLFFRVRAQQEAAMEFAFTEEQRLVQQTVRQRVNVSGLYS